jgi:hypothetical protein
LSSGLSNDFESTIRTTIIDQHYFMRPTRNLIQNETDPTEEFRNDPFFIVNRDCHRNAKATAHLLAFPFITFYKPNELGHFGDGKQVFMQFLSSHRFTQGDVGVAMALTATGLPP